MRTPIPAGPCGHGIRFARAAALLLLLLLPGAPPPAAADTYLIVPATAAAGIGTATSVPFCLASDDQYATLGRLKKGEFKTNRILAGSFGVGYSEEQYGYIGVDMKAGIEYRHWNANIPHTATEYIQLCYRRNPQGNPNAYTDIAPLDTTSGVALRAASPDHSLQMFTIPNFKTDYGTWAAIRGDTARGFDFGLYWEYPNVNPPAGSPLLYIDHLFLRVLAKLLVYDWTDEAGNAGFKYGGATVTEAATNVPLLRFTTKVFSNTSIKVNSLRVDLEGAGLAAADLTAVKLARDLNKNGVFDGADTIAGTVTTPNALTNIVFSGSPLLNNVPHAAHYLILVDIADAACATVNPKYVGARIVDETYLTLNGSVDEIVRNVDLKTTDASVVDNITPTPVWPMRTGDSDAARVRIIKKANVTATLVAPVIPITRNMGETFAVTVQLTNEAGTVGTAENVLLVTPLTADIVAPSPAAFTSDTPIPLTLAAGVSTNVTLTFTASAAGVIRYSGRATYHDPGSKLNRTTADTANSADITIQYLAVPILQIESFTLAPNPNLTGTCSDDQPLALSVTVRNAGDATANQVKLVKPSSPATEWDFDHLPASGRATVTRNAGSWSTQNIAPGGSYTWSFAFTPTVPTSGGIYLAGRAVESGGAFGNGNSNLVQVVNAGRLQIAASGFDTVPGDHVVGKNSSFNVVLKVANPGGAAVKTVIPGLPGVAVQSGAPDPLPARTAGPDQSGITVNPGETKTITWVYASNCGNNIGDVNITNGLATGKDVNSDYAKSTGAATTLFASTGSYLTINNNVYPKINPPPQVSARIDMMIGYSVNSNYFVADTNSRIHCYDQNGNLKWGPAQLPAGTVSGLDIWVESSSGKDVCFVGTSAGRIYAIQDEGATWGGYGAWDPEFQYSYASLTEGPVHGILYYGGYLYVTAGKTIFRVDVADRQIIWSQKVNDSVTPLCVPAIDNGLVYVGLDDGTIRSFAVGTGVAGGACVVGGGTKFGSPFVFDGVLFASNYATGVTGRVVKIPDCVNAMNASLSWTTGAAAFSDPWVDFDRHLWFSGLANGNLYRVDGETMTAIAGWPVSPNAQSAISWLGPPIQYAGYVYVGSSYTTGGTTYGKAWILDAATGLRITDSWPYQAVPDATYTNRGMDEPVCLDPFNRTFLLGGNDARVYIFAMP